MYVADSGGSDLVLLGKVEAELSNDRSVTSDFAARLVIDDTEMSLPKVKLYQTFLVSVQSALQPLVIGHTLKEGLS